MHWEALVEMIDTKVVGIAVFSVSEESIILLVARNCMKYLFYILQWMFSLTAVDAIYKVVYETNTDSTFHMLSMKKHWLIIYIYDGIHSIVHCTTNDVMI